MFIKGYGTLYGGLFLCGVAAAPSTDSDSGSLAVINLIGAKNDGVDGLTGLADNENLLKIQNFQTNKVYVRGNGDIKTLGIITAESSKRVACGGGGSGGTTTAAGTISLEINGTLYYLLRAASA